MPRYIDADKVEKWTWQEPKYSDSINDRTDLRDFLRSLPTVSPDEVRGVGEWIRQEKSHPNCQEDSDYRYECSVCGWSDQHNAKMIVPFCWHCGARMKGAEDGTTE